MDNWQVGDKAVCIEPHDSICGHCIPDYFDGRIKKGDIVTVSLVAPKPYGIFLDFYEAPASESPPESPPGLFCSCTFRKIKPDEASGDLEDWNLILSQIKKREKA